MSHYFKKTLLFTLLIATAPFIACTRQVNTPVSASTGADADERSLPFDQATRKDGGSIVAPLREIPPGTILVVRLHGALSSRTSRAGDEFESVLDAPIMVEGQTLVARGANIQGRVIAAKSSDRPQDPSYIRITLTGLSAGGNHVALQTSTVFAKGGAHELLSPVPAAESSRAVTEGGNADGRRNVVNAAQVEGINKVFASAANNDAELPVERRLTFRLTQTAKLLN